MSRAKHMPNFERIYGELYKYVYDKNYKPEISALQVEGMSYEIEDLEKDLKFRDKLVELKQQIVEVLEL